jgi:hypothetical protein
MTNEQIFERILHPLKQFKAIHQNTQPMTEQENLQENIQFGHLMEMSVLRKNETGLPVNIWVDEGNTYQKPGHEPRIKIQSDNGDHPNSRNMIPMSISDDPEILINDQKLSLSKNEINLIKQFIRINLSILQQFGNTIGIIEFSRQMKKIAE